nr:recombinase family protein [uncultured Oscillibacter sp.]
MSKAAYVRVSTAEQNEARQREALAVRGIDKWFIEKASGKNTDRPEFQKMLDWVREGDTIYVHDLSRIARSTKDLLDLLDVLREKGVALVSGKESIDTSTATGKLLVTMVAAINEFERANLLERQKEGIAIAKREGKYKGRKAVTVPDLPRHYERYQRREVSKAALARELGISRPTLDRLFSDYNSCATEKRM